MFLVAILPMDQFLELLEGPRLSQELHEPNNASHTEHAQNGDFGGHIGSQIEIGKNKFLSAKAKDMVKNIWKSRKDS